MKKRNKKIHNDPWEQDFYETGSTQPPKNRGGLTAVLLVLVILLGGTCSALGIMNLRLFMQLTAQSEDPGTLNVFGTDPRESTPASLGDSADSIEFPRMGMAGQTVSDFDRRFYALPQGVLVTGVMEDAWAHRAGIHAGDVITVFGGHTIKTQEDLENALAASAGGASVLLEFYRHQTGKQMQTHITLPEE